MQYLHVKGNQVQILGSAWVIAPVNRACVLLSARVTDSVYQAVAHHTVDVSAGAIKNSERGRRYKILFYLNKTEADGGETCLKR